jgi:hypothetical protein
VPQNAPPGGHFAVIWWSTAPPGASGVSIVTRAGMLVYLQVSGDVRESGKLLRFSPTPDSRFMSELPNTFSVQFENTGNTYLKPSGEIRVKNVFGSLRATYGVNKANLILLPGTTNDLRITKPDLALPFAFGVYTAELALRFGEKPETVKQIFYFFVFPWKAVLGALILLLIVLFGITRGLRRYNQWIIAKHIGK